MTVPNALICLTCISFYVSWSEVAEQSVCEVYTERSTNVTLGLTEPGCVARSWAARAGGAPCLVWTAHFLRPPVCLYCRDRPDLSFPNKHAGTLPVCFSVSNYSRTFFFYFITVVLYPKGPSPHLCLLKCNSPFICNPTSPTKYPGFLHTSLLFFLQCPLVPAHGQLLWHLPHTALDLTDWCVSCVCT